MSNSVTTIDTSTSAGEATAESDNASETRIPIGTSQSSASMLRHLVTKMQANENINNKNSRNGIDSSSLEESLSKLDKMSEEINMIFEDTDYSESQSRSSAGNSSGDGLKPSSLNNWIEQTYKSTSPSEATRTKLNEHSKSRRARSISTTHTVTPPSSDSSSPSPASGHSRANHQHHHAELASERDSCKDSTHNTDDESITLSSSGRVIRHSMDAENMKRNAERTERLEKKIRQVHEEEESSSSSIRFELEKTKSDESMAELAVAGALRKIMATSSEEESSESGSDDSSSSGSSHEEVTRGATGGHSPRHKAVRATPHSYDSSPTVSSPPPRQHEPDEEECQPYHPQPRSPPRHEIRRYPLHQIPEDSSGSGPVQTDQEGMEHSFSEMDEMMAWYREKEENIDTMDAFLPGIRTSSSSTSSTCSHNPGSRVNSNSSSVSHGRSVGSDLSSVSPGSRVNSDASASSNFSMSPYYLVVEGDSAPLSSQYTVPPPQQPPGDSHPGEPGGQAPSAIQPEENTESSLAVASAGSSRASSPSPDSVGWEELGLSEGEREALHRYEQSAGGNNRRASLDSTDVELLLLEQEMLAMQDKQSSKRSIGSSDNGSVDWAEVGLSKEERQQMHSLGGEFLRQQVAELARYELQRDSRQASSSVQSTQGSGSLSDSIALELSRYETKELEKLSRERAGRRDPPSSSDESSQDSSSTSSGSSSDSTNSAIAADPELVDALMVGMKAPSSDEMLKKKKKSRSSKRWDSSLPGAYPSNKDPDETYCSLKGASKKSHKHKAGKAAYHSAGDEEASSKILISTGAHSMSNTSSLLSKEKSKLAPIGNEEVYVDLLHEESFVDEPASGELLPLHRGNKMCDRRKLVICCISGWVLALIVVAFMMGVLVTSSLQDDSSNESGSTGTLSLSETLSKVALQGGTEFNNPESYQSRALAWLQDNANLTRYSEAQKIQRWVLGCFYFSTTDVENAHTWISADKWLSNAEECTWKGVVCDGIGRSVVALELPNNRLRGVVPPEISLLSSTLVTLNLHNNLLTNSGDDGHSFFQELTKLRRLNIGSNDFIYEGIPLQFAKLTDLLVLDISNLGYSGELKGKVFQRLHLLKDLRMGGNYFNSSIPMEIGKIKSLEYLHVENSGITGDLSFTKPMNNVIELWLDRNPDMEGTIPTNLGNTSTLGSLSLSECGLTGQIPTELGWLTKLESLWLADNELTGTVPKELGSMVQLRRLEITGNDLSGTMPAEVCVMTRPPGILALLEADCVDEVICDCCTRCY